MCWIKKSETRASYLSGHNIIPSILLLQGDVQVIKKIENSVSLDVIKKKNEAKRLNIDRDTGENGWWLRAIQANLFSDSIRSHATDYQELHIWGSDRLLQIRRKFTKLDANFPKQMDQYKIERNIKN